MRDYQDYLFTLINALLLKHPARAAAGGLLGLFFVSLNNIASGFIRKKGDELFYNGPTWYLLVMGYVLVYIPTIVNLAVTKAEFDEDIEDALRLIKLSDLTQVQRRQVYLNLCEKVVARVANSRTKIEKGTATFRDPTASA
jgi:hypothetical protein